MTRATSKPPKAVELTFDQYMATPLTRLRHDVIDGVIVMSPAPDGRPLIWLVTGEFYRRLHDFVKSRHLGTVIVSPIDMLIRKVPKLRVRQPEVAFFSAARGSAARRVAAVENRGNRPDLAIEVRSEQESEARWLEKLADYAAIGVAEVWRVFLQTETVQVLTLDAGHYETIGLFRNDEIIRSRVLPDLALSGRVLLRLSQSHALPLDAISKFASGIEGRNADHRLGTLARSGPGPRNVSSNLSDPNSRWPRRPVGSLQPNSVRDARESLRSFQEKSRIDAFPPPWLEMLGLATGRGGAASRMAVHRVRSGANPQSATIRNFR